MSNKSSVDWNIFHEQDNNIQFAENGYLILHIDNPTIFSALKALISDQKQKYAADFTATLLVADIEHRKLMHLMVSNLLEEIVQKYFRSYRQICAGFALKKANSPSSSMPFHQDISMKHPDGRPAISFWMPLVSTNSENGNLQVVPGSHLNFRHPRAAGTPFPMRNKEDDLRSHYLQDLPTQLGQFIVFDQALFHTSPPNWSTQARPVATSVLIPEESSVYYYHRAFDKKPVQLEAYAVSDEFYFEHQLGTRPKSIQCIDTVIEQNPIAEPELSNGRLAPTSN